MMQPHIRNSQPNDTFGKRVAYITKGGHRHMPYHADELNWKTKGMGRAEVGAIVQYEIIDEAQK
jgi:hypothetical protein